MVVNSDGQEKTAFDKLPRGGFKILAIFKWIFLLHKEKTLQSSFLMALRKPSF